MLLPKDAHGEAQSKWWGLPQISADDGLLLLHPPKSAELRIEVLSTKLWYQAAKQVAYSKTNNGSPSTTDATWCRRGRSGLQLRCSFVASQ